MLCFAVLFFEVLCSAVFGRYLTRKYKKDIEEFIYVWSPSGKFKNSKFSTGGSLCCLSHARAQGCTCNMQYRLLTMVLHYFTDQQGALKVQFKDMDPIFMYIYLNKCYITYCITLGKTEKSNDGCNSSSNV